MRAVKTGLRVRVGLGSEPGRAFKGTEGTSEEVDEERRTEEESP